MPSSYSLPKLIEAEINALISAGYYSSKSDVVKDALRHLMKSKKSLRYAAAVELCREGKISAGKGAEIAEMGILEFRKMLEERGIRHEIKAERSELEKIREVR